MSTKPTKRARGTGGIGFDKSTQRWYATIWLSPGKSRKFWSPKGGTQKEALAKLKAFEGAMARGEITADGGKRNNQLEGTRMVTWGDWMTYWLQVEVASVYQNGDRAKGLSPATFAKYRIAVEKHLRPAFGTLRLVGPQGHLTKVQLQTWRTSMLAKGQSMANIYALRTVMYTLAQAAVNNSDATGVLANPLTGFEVPQGPRAAKRPVDMGAVGAVIAAAEGTQWQLLLQLGFALGLRRGELAGLRFGDFDLDAKVPALHVQRRVLQLSLVQGQTKDVFNGLKCHDDSPSERTRSLGIDAEVWRPLLAQHRKLLAERALRTRKWTGSAPTSAEAYLFPDTHGEPSSPVVITGAVKAIFVKAGHPDRTLHQLRHDYASWMREQGVPLDQVSKFLGHSSVQVTERVYVELRDDYIRQAQAQHNPLAALRPALQEVVNA